MAGYKGMALVLLRQWIRAAGPDVERQVLEQLTPEEQIAYASLVATAWVPVELATKLYVVASPLLYPKDPRPLRQVGRDLARENLGGVFRFVVRVISVAMLVDKTASLWRSFHDRGAARAIREADHMIRFEVTDYPELPERMRETIVGWLAQAIELTGAKNVRVVKSDDDPRTWTWTATWR